MLRKTLRKCRSEYSRRHFPAISLSDATVHFPEEAPALPAELEARIAALEADRAPADFDVVCWLWMVLIGIAIPLTLLVIGWLL